jgi:predicted flap endonuclease-1-like 5' DNA nuclease/cbb3-type cytochrome oxidase subunit 3
MDNSTTSAPGASLLPDGIAVLTTIHFALLAALALFAVAVIVWGMRLRRRRREADRELAAHNEEVAAHAASDQPVSPPVAPPPVAPAPPPATDEIVVGTPAPPEPLAVEPQAPEPVADAPVADPAPPMTATAADGPVTQLKGLGPKVAARLAELGITSVGQLAALDTAGAAALDAQLGTFAGRMTRDRWLDQARLLAAGDKPGFEAVFGKL